AIRDIDPAPSRSPPAAPLAPASQDALPGPAWSCLVLPGPACAGQSRTTWRSHWALNPTTARPQPHQRVPLWPSSMAIVSHWPDGTLQAIRLRARNAGSMMIRSALACVPPKCRPTDQGRYDEATNCNTTMRPSIRLLQCLHDTLSFAASGYATRL